MQFRNVYIPELQCMLEYTEALYICLYSLLMPTCVMLFFLACNQNASFLKWNCGWTYPTLANMFEQDVFALLKLFMLHLICVKKQNSWRSLINACPYLVNHCMRPEVKHVHQKMVGNLQPWYSLIFAVKTSLNLTVK